MIFCTRHNIFSHERACVCVWVERQMRNAIANGKSFFKRKKSWVSSLLGFEMKSISGFWSFFDLGHRCERLNSEPRPGIARIKVKMLKISTKLTDGTEFFSPSTNCNRFHLTRVLLLINKFSLFYCSCWIHIHQNMQKEWSGEKKTKHSKRQALWVS